jgi:hypothetical protein
MNCTKAELEQAILAIAKMYGKEESYKALMSSVSAGLPKLTEMISFEMFLHEFDYRSCADDIYAHYRLILEYSLELHSKGFVEFK